MNLGRYQLNGLCWRANPLSAFSFKPGAHGIPRAVPGTECCLFPIFGLCEFLHDHIEDRASHGVFAKPVKRVAFGFAVCFPDTILLNTVASLLCFWAVC